MHLIPWELLREAVSLTGDEAAADSLVTVNNQLFQLLLEAAIAGQAFDETTYLLANPDVAASVRQGSCASGASHYRSNGYFEGRDTGGVGFSESWYMSRYPDVRQALANGYSASGYEHFRGPGQREWRSPNQAAEPDIARWRAALSARRQAADGSPVHPTQSPFGGPAMAQTAKQPVGAHRRGSKSPRGGTGSSPVPPVAGMEVKPF